jgi:TPR repeat protein
MKAMLAASVVLVGSVTGTLIVRGADAAPPAAASAPSALSPAEASFWQAVELFRSPDPAQQKRGRAALDFSADRDYAPALLMLGECYQAGGYGYPKRASRAADAFETAAGLGNGFAMVKFAACLQAGTGMRRNGKEAIAWLNRALEEKTSFVQPVPPAGAAASSPTGDAGVAGTAAVDPVANARAQAHYLLGVILQPKNPAEAQVHFVAAATAGPAGRDGIQEAAVQAALAYALGKGIPRDHAKALEMLEQSRRLARRAGVWMVHNFAAAKLVDEFAVSQLEDTMAEQADAMTAGMQVQIAQQLTDRKSKDYNPAEAAQWFELAAQSGQPWAMLELAFLHTRGDLGQPDPAQAFKWFEQAGSGTPPKHLLGVANTVICLTNGLGTAPDPERALTLARANQETDIVCHLAVIGQCPRKVVTFEEELALNENWAEERHDAQAECTMGIRYLNGWGVKADAGKAEKWLKQAARQGNGPGCRILGYLYETMPGAFGLRWPDSLEEAAKLYAQGAAAGDDEATCNLANFHSTGRGVPESREISISLYEQVLKRNPTHGRALNNLGSIFENQSAEEEKRGEKDRAAADLAKAVELYRKSDATGFSYAANNLGRLYRGEALGAPDLEKAYGYFARAAEEGNDDARLEVASMLERGEGVPVSMAESAYYLRQAAVDGNTKAMQRLADYYVYGKGGTRDYDRAMFWFQQMQRAGDFRATRGIITVLLEQGRYSEAIKMLQPMADHDFSGFASERLSRCYRDGTGVKADPRRAQKYLEQAVQLDFGDALVRMANNALAAGKEADALRLFQQAAGRGNARANYALGQMSYFGQHLPKDVEKAMSYFRVAALDYDPDALYFLAALTAKHVDGAPSLDNAIRMARAAEALEHPKAAALRELLERRRLKELSAPAQTTGARAM